MTVLNGLASGLKCQELSSRALSNNSQITVTNIVTIVKKAQNVSK